MKVKAGSGGGGDEVGARRSRYRRIRSRSAATAADTEGAVEEVVEVGSGGLIGERGAGIRSRSAVIRACECARVKADSQEVSGSGSVS